MLITQIYIQLTENIVFYHVPLRKLMEIEGQTGVILLFMSTFSGEGRGTYLPLESTGVPSPVLKIHVNNNNNNNAPMSLTWLVMTN